LRASFLLPKDLLPRVYFGRKAGKKPCFKTDAERGCSIIINAGVINKLFVFIKKNVYFYILNYYILIFLDYFNMLILKLIFLKILFCQYKQNTSYVSRSESEFFCFLLLTKFSITKYRVSS